MMHALMSFLGCIATLMKASGVDILIGAAFAGMTSIVNGKAWANALWAYRFITAVLLQKISTRVVPRHMRSCVSTWRQPENTQLGGYGWIALSNQHMSVDQFGEQTYIKRGKGSGCMKGISTSAEQVAVWVNSFSVCGAHLDIAIEHTYNEDGRSRSHRAE